MKIKGIFHHCNYKCDNSKFKCLINFQSEHYLLSIVIYLILTAFTINTK